MDRFRSKQLRGARQELITAAYIDLNPVRAELVSEPQEYRWCGYTEALEGKAEAQRGLCETMRISEWAKVLAGYRAMLRGESTDGADGTIRAAAMTTWQHRLR
jgi:hypothetical protein